MFELEPLQLHQALDSQVGFVSLTMIVTDPIAMTAGERRTMRSWSSEEVNKQSYLNPMLQTLLVAKATAASVPTQKRGTHLPANLTVNA